MDYIADFIKLGNAHICCGNINQNATCALQIDVFVAMDKQWPFQRLRVRRCSPVAEPMPIIAAPIPDITVLTSAKSTLIMPGWTMNSVIPCTASSNTSLAALKAFIKDTLLPSTGNNFWLGIVIKESTYFSSSRMPCSATDCFFLPSKRKGLVTTATVRIPISRAICAITGMAPCTRSTPHTGGQENHVRALQNFFNAIFVFFSSMFANFRIGTRTQAFG